MLEGKNNTYFLPWEIRSIFMQFQPPQHGRENTLYLFCFFSAVIYRGQKQVKAGGIIASFDFSEITKNKIITIFFNEK